MSNLVKGYIQTAPIFLQNLSTTHGKSFPTHTGERAETTLNLEETLCFWINENKPNSSGKSLRFIVMYTRNIQVERSVPD